MGVGEAKVALRVSRGLVGAGSVSAGRAWAAFGQWRRGSRAHYAREPAEADWHRKLIDEVFWLLTYWYIVSHELALHLTVLAPEL